MNEKYNPSPEEMAKAEEMMTDEQRGMSEKREREEKIKEELNKIRKIVEENAQRVAELGKWPAYIEPGSLLERIPQEIDQKSPGFDAGLACSMDLIPRDKQELAAKLHANYGKESVMQIRKESGEENPDSQTSWWLSACSVCREGEIDGPAFLKQVEDFKKLAEDSKIRLEVARKEFENMTHSFALKEGMPYGEKDGCIQGAYIAGYPYGTHYSENYGLYFIGTYEDSLGLEDFKWSEEKDEKGRAKSGPVFGSKQFIKCANEDEWRRASEVVKSKLFIESK